MSLDRIILTLISKRGVKKVIINFVIVILHLIDLAVGVSVDDEFSIEPKSAGDSAENHTLNIIERAAAVGLLGFILVFHLVELNLELFVVELDCVFEMLCGPPVLGGIIPGAVG